MENNYNKDSVNITHPEHSVSQNLVFNNLIIMKALI